jgi:hypothetical protein
MRCFSDDGSIEINDEIIHTGCDETPLRNSYFCDKHRFNSDSLTTLELDEQ